MYFVRKRHYRIHQFDSKDIENVYIFDVASLTYYPL